MKSLGKASKRKLAFGRESLKDDVIHRNIDGDGDVHAVCGCNIVRIDISEVMMFRDHSFKTKEVCVLGVH